MSAEAAAQGPQAGGRDGQRRRAVRPAVAIVVAAVVLGAIVGSLVRPGTVNRYEADAMVVLPGGTGEELDALRAMAKLPQVLDAARTATTESADLAERVRVEQRPAADAIVVKAWASSVDGAFALANAVGAAAVEYREIARALRGTPLSLGDFENGLGPWAPPPDMLASGPRRVGVVSGEARFDSYSLRSLCSPDVACGLSRVVRYPFRAGAPYRFSAWLRTPERRAEAWLVAGDRGDRASGAPVVVRDRWTRVELTWTPAADRAETRLSVVLGKPGAPTLYLDGVSMTDVSAATAAGRSGGAAAEPESPPALFAAVPGPIRDGTHTALAAVLGALGGLVVALAGLRAARMAGRQRDRHP